MDTSPYEALAEAATDGVEFDGLRVERTGDRLTVETPETTLTGPVSTARTALSDVDEYVTNWFFWHQRAPQAEARWSFLRWLERAADAPVLDRYDALGDGISRSWGQLRVTVTLGPEGTRRYDLRHTADATDTDADADATNADADATASDTNTTITDATAVDLERYDDPRDARRIAKLDADGRYRPLKTAPTLRDGWVFPDLDAADLVAAVDFLYPATIENWHREREGDLDVSHWHETMARQTGIYGVIETLDRNDGHEHVEWVAEACCADSQCLKRREWDYDAETPLETDGGDGVFPCREPCSVVVSAARQWTKLEGEQSRSYEFELTPSEKAQLESIVEAVADGRIDDIRAADVRDDANQLRVRFLRAKLFDDEGNLDGVPTERE
ncbi:MAG: DR2241 family protein [Halapricum sp.]